MDENGTTIAAQIATYAATRPGEPAVTCGDETLTWAALVSGAARMARHFEDAGAGAGDAVVLLLPNGCAVVQAALGAWWIGATPTPVSPKLPAPERDGLLELAAPAVVVVEGPEATPVSTGAPVLTLADLAAPVVGTREPSAVASPCWKAIGSGGSSGRPKLIVAEQPATVEALGGAGDLLRIPTAATIVVPGPLSHNAPFICTAFGLMRGNHVVLMPRFDAAGCLRLVQAHRARWLYQVPTMMLRIWRLPERPAHDVRSLEVVFHMAAPCPPWLKREWCGWLGAGAVLELYGGTEMQAVTIVSGTEWLARPGTVGRAVLGEIEVRDEAGRPLPAGEIGELWMRRGPGEPAPYHYVGASPRTAEDHWESLGDNGHVDADGYVFLADRAADMIVVGGSNVYPAELEAALDAHPAVRSSCVIGLPDADLGDVPHALVELTEPVATEELVTWMRERVAGYKIPRSFERVSEPLRDDAGKVRRGRLRAERLGEGALAR
jgi:bile acid-coenzyme A ligase